MKFLVDRCAGRKLAEHLRAAGHDVVRATDLGPDPGDAALLHLANLANRVLVTIDTDFGALLFLKQAPHCGIVRLPDVPAERRIQLMDTVLAHHEADLDEGAVITVRGGRIRVSRSNQKPR